MAFFVVASTIDWRTSRLRRAAVCGPAVSSGDSAPRLRGPTRWVAWRFLPASPGHMYCCDLGQLVAVGHSELGEHTCEVALHRDCRNEQLAGDLGVAQVLGDEGNDLALGRGEAVPT